MEEDEIEEWVEKKLDKGISEKALRNSLKKSGHDPSLVEEVKKRRQDDTGEETEENEPPTSGTVDLSKSHEDDDERKGGHGSSSNGSEKSHERTDETGEDTSVEEKVEEQKTVDQELEGQTSEPPEVDSETDSGASEQKYKRSLGLSLPTGSLKTAFSGVGGAVRRRKRGVAGVLVLVLLIAAVPFVPVEKVSASVQSSVQGIENPLEAPERPSESPDSETSGEESSSEDGGEAVSNMTSVEFRQGGANPASLTVPSGSRVLFVNEQSMSYHINFERGPEDLTLKPGGSDSAEFNMTVYYTATPVDAEEPEIYGSVIVE